MMGYGKRLSQRKTKCESGQEEEDEKVMEA
jgi:hypothetical protein